MQIAEYLQKLQMFTVRVIKCVASSVLCSVIDFKKVLMVYCKQRIIELYFERRISYGKVPKVLAVEGFQLPKQTVGQPYSSK